MPARPAVAEPRPVVLADALAHLVDTGLVYQVAHSGRTVWRSATMATMVEDLRAGRFDLLLTGYSDRWQRNLRWTSSSSRLGLPCRSPSSHAPHDGSQRLAQCGDVFGR